MAAAVGWGVKGAGLENGVGVITAAYLKDANDPAWKDDQATVEWQSFLEKYRRAGGTDEGAAMFGYAAAEPLAQVLRQCGNDLSRQNVMKKAAALHDYHSSVLLPGIKI